jgi:hypothetical protein
MSVYLDIPINLLPIFKKILKNLEIVNSKSIHKAKFIFIYPFNDSIIKLCQSLNIQYINNFNYIFTGNYLQSNYLLMDYLYNNDYRYKKYLLYYLVFNNKNYTFLEKSFLLESPNKNKWLLFDEDLHYQKIIYNYHEIYTTIKDLTYSNWRLQKMLSKPTYIIKCYVFFFNYSHYKKVFLHSLIPVIDDDNYHLAHIYFSPTKYNYFYKRILKIINNTILIYNNLFTHTYNSKYSYSILEYIFHTDSSYKNKLFLHNVHVLPTITWPSLIYTVYYDMFSYLKNRTLNRFTLIYNDYQMHQINQINKKNQKNRLSHYIALLLFIVIIFIFIKWYVHMYFKSLSNL